jgi:hypothetical protein
MKAISPEEAAKRSVYLQLAKSQERQAAEFRAEAEEAAHDGDTLMQAICLRSAEGAEMTAAAFREDHEKMLASLPMPRKKPPRKKN